MKVKNKITGETSEGPLLVTLDTGADAGEVLEWPEHLERFEIVEASEIEQLWVEEVKASAPASSRP